APPPIRSCKRFGIAQDGGGVSRRQGLPDASGRTALRRPEMAAAPSHPGRTAETFLDDASRLAERARKTDVAVSYEEAQDMIHVWHLFAPMLEERQQPIDHVGEFVRKQ